MAVPRTELRSLDMIWDGARHCAFTDLARHKGRWLCAFREASSHMLCPGKVRVIASSDGQSWESAALVSRRGVDLRDPKLCPAPGGRLDLVMGSSPIAAGTYAGRSTMAARSDDGLSWDAPRRVTCEGDWLWRVERSGGAGYGLSYRLPSKRRWTVHLLKSEDGFAYREIADLGVPGLPSEGTLRFRGQKAVALVRREAGSGRAWVGRSGPPYRRWSWRECGERLGGPNFIVLPDGSMLAAARVLRRGRPLVALLSMKGASLRPLLELPSGGDCGYPGMVLHRGELWMSYYSSHEGGTRIYLARIGLRLRARAAAREGEARACGRA